jgi:hypothetical protein
MLQMLFPPRLSQALAGAAPADVTLVIAAANQLMGIGFIAEKSITVKKVALRFGAISGSADVIVSIYATLATDGSPTGTAIVQQTIAANTLTANAWNEITFTTTGNITIGTRYVIDVRAAATFATTSVALVAGNTNYNDASFLPYSYGTVTGTTTYTPSTTRFTEQFAIIDNSGTPNCIGGMGTADTTIPLGGSGTPVLEAGNRFKIASSICQTYKVMGIRVTADSTAQTTPNIVVSVYDWSSGNNSTALQQDTFGPYTNNITGRAVADYFFSSPATLSAGSEYIASIGLSATSGTTIMTVGSNSDAPNAYKPVLWDQTNDYSYDRVSRTSLTGSWTATTDSIVSLQLIIEVVSFPSSGGGLLVHPGMTGRVNG